MTTNKILASIYIGSNRTPTPEEMADFVDYCSREIENTLDPTEIKIPGNSETRFSVSEASYSKDESLLTIVIGCDTSVSLKDVHDKFLDVFDSLASDLVDPENNEYGLKADLIDFTNLKYQSYSEGNFDEGNFSDSDDYDSVIEDFKNEIEEKNASIIKKWLAS